MESQIFYFSGTGNSLATARMINEKLIKKSEIISIPAIDNKLVIKADRVGLVFPVYCNKVPDIVKQFIIRMEFTVSPYIYAVATHAGSPGQSLFDVQKLLAKKGQSLSLGIAVAMPGNAYETKPEIELERLSVLEQKAREIANSIEIKQKGVVEGSNGSAKRIKNRIRFFVAWNYVFSSKRFKTANNCTGCGICEKICPVNNIHLIDNKPIWKKECTACLACFHWCPQEAIYMNNFVIKKRRKYHHPDISASDMICAKGYLK